MSTKGSFYSNGTQVYTDTNPAGPADTPVTDTPSPAPSSFYGGSGQPYAAVETMNATLAEVDTALASAQTAATSATGSASAAATSATNAATSESQAATQATNAASSASAASTSAASASASATAAAGSASGASTSATNAASSATAAASSASAASASQTGAATSATNAANSASAASTSASNAAASAAAAATTADTEIANRAIRYDAAQALTGPQQTQARSNAGITSLSLTISGHAVSLGGTLALAPADVSLGNVTNNAQTQAAVVPNTVPTTGQTLVGSGTAYVPKSISGDATLASTGALTVTKTNGVLFGTAATLNAGTAVGNVVQLDATTGKLPAVDGSLLTGLKSGVGGCGQFKYSSATACLFSPYNGDQIRIAGTLYNIPSAGISFANTGLSASTLYYAYVWNNAGTLTGELVTTGHSTDTTTGNVGTEIKTGANSRTLVGIVRTNASSQFVDSATQRFVRSWFNRTPVGAINAFTASRAITSVQPTFAEVNSEIRNEFVLWAGESVSVGFSGAAFPAASVNAWIELAVAFDSTSTPETAPYMKNLVQCGTTAQTVGPTAISGNKSGLSEGYHYATVLGMTSSTTGAPATDGLGQGFSSLGIRIG